MSHVDVCSPCWEELFKMWRTGICSRVSNDIDEFIQGKLCFDVACKRIHAPSLCELSAYCPNPQIINTCPPLSLFPSSFSYFSYSPRLFFKWTFIKVRSQGCWHLPTVAFPPDYQWDSGISWFISMILERTSSKTLASKLYFVLWVCGLCGWALSTKRSRFS